MKYPKILYFLIFLYLVLSCSSPQVYKANPPYPQSPVISSVSFDWSTHERWAPGSDNWPITWADDNHQYTAWGDGGGFRGTNRDGRVSLGVARIEGGRDSYTGYNVWGGKNPENRARFGGKSYGIISVAGVLYMWVSPGSNATSYSEARLYSSVDHGATWKPADWAFIKSDDMILPTFLQFDKDYAGARDNYVYIYANHLKKGDSLSVQKPGEIALMRVPKTGILERNQYEFFAGLDNDDNQTWTTDIAARQPVFKDENGIGWNTSVSYNSGLERYLLITEHTSTMKGYIGIFEAAEPWGPWATVLYDNQFGRGYISQTTFFYNFSNKWLSEDGKSFVFIFTGIKSNDSWNTVNGSFSTY